MDITAGFYQYFLSAPSAALVLHLDALPRARAEAHKTKGARRRPNSENVIVLSCHGARGVVRSYRSRQNTAGVGRWAAIVCSYTECARPHLFVRHSVIADHTDPAKLLLQGLNVV